MALPNSFDILQAIVEATPDAIFVKDLDGRYVLVNGAAARFLQRAPSEIVGKNDLELYPEETARKFIADDQRVLATGEAQSFEGIATSESGTQAYLVTKGVYRDAGGRSLGTFGISHDITELRLAHQTIEHTREALFQSQKMEAVGQLTGGIAHDFNNILAVVLGNAELLRLHLPQDPYAHELIDTLLRAALHGQDLTGDLLSFSRRRQLNPQRVAINALVEGIVRLLSRTLGAKVRISTTTTSDSLVAFVDSSALEAALLNVALNARDAMADGGSLTIRTSKTAIHEAPHADDDLTPGLYAAVALQDTGAGMAPDVVARVFEPFFTTKTTGKGTGLGLSMVYGFAKQSGGTVTIVSAPGLGTTVTMYLPLATTQASPPAVEDAPKVQSEARCVLLVEDEASVRHTVRRQLEHLGHRVFVSDTAGGGLALLDEIPEINLLLTDVVLGTGMNGADLADAVRSVRPGLAVIFMSGYTADSEAQRRIRASGAPLLSKPATIAQLERAIAEIIAS